MSYLLTTSGYFSAHRIGISLVTEILRVAQNDSGKEAAVGTATLAKRDVEINHVLTEQELGLAEESLRRVSLDRVDTGLVGRDVVEINTQVNLLALIINLTGSGGY